MGLADNNNIESIGRLDRQPENINFLNTPRFKLLIHRLPNTEYFTQECNLPGISMGNATQPTPFVDKPIPGDKVQFEEFSVSFAVDEDLRNYKELFNWITQLGFPKNFGQYRQIKQSVEGIWSDMVLMLLDNENNANLSVRFINAFPTSLSGLQFTTKDSDAIPIYANVTFKYEQYDFPPI